MRTLASTLALHKPASRRLRSAAVVLIASGVIHLALVLALGLSWAGPVSLRKAVTFGLSIGMLLWTVGWVIDRLASRPRLERWLGTSLALSGLAEVALITGQAWRGVPSHFNYTTPEDIVVFVFMGISVAVLSIGLLVTTVWAIAKPPVEPVVRLAVRAGMLLVLTGLGIGQWIIELGNDFFEQFGQVPDQVIAGAAGVPTFPHALAFHGIQLFILAAIVTGLLGLQAHTAQRVVRLVVAGYAVLLVWSIVQTAAGRAPVDLVRAETLLAALGAGLLGTAAVLLLIGWRRARVSQAPAPHISTRAETESAVPSAL